MIYNIHNLIDITIDPRVDAQVVKSIDFQIAYFKTTKRIETKSKYQIFVKPFEDLKIDTPENLHTFHTVQGITGEYLVDDIAKFALKKNQKSYIIYASKSFLINLFIQMFLIREGISLVHAAGAVNAEGDGILLPGAGGVGKTVLLGFMVKEQGYKLLGDDIVGLNKNGTCFSFPRAFVLKEYHREVYPEVFERLGIGRRRKKFAPALVKVIIKNAPFVGITKTALKRLKLYEDVIQSLPSPAEGYLATVPVKEIFDPNCIADQGTIKRIIFLERYAGSEFKIQSISEESLARRMSVIIHHEWVQSMRRLFTLGALEIEDVDTYFNNVAGIIRSGISYKKCEILFIPDNTAPKELSDYFSKII